MADTTTEDTPQTRATLKYLRTSAYKVREVLDLIRGLDVDDARHVLQFSERGPAREVLKVLNSAVANAAFFRHPPRVPPTRPGLVVARDSGKPDLDDRGARLGTFAARRGGRSQWEDSGCRRIPDGRRQ